MDCEEAAQPIEWGLGGRWPKALVARHDVVQGITLRNCQWIGSWLEFRSRITACEQVVRGQGEQGAVIGKTPKFEAMVSIAGRLVTGQNPASAKGVWEEMVMVLGEVKVETGR